ncbi:RNA polymerase sigma factor [Stagnimonas aquatica]|uniref:RNA polymerase sigma factor n=1 Tax=Stagnimonas aquatica TaxID=2689987 RepID=UPI0018F6F0F4|nr:RNA polymerase sigma factor [Stagnimonas aquatica]
MQTVVPTAATAIDARVTASARSRTSTLASFLAGVERRALRIAQLGTGGDADEALDCVQESMIQLARHYADHDPAEWPPLFYRILDNRLRKWRYKQLLRGRWLGQRQFDNEDEEESALERLPAPESERPETLVAGAQVRQRLRRALQNLPHRQRQAFLLRHWEGLSTSETAQAMACSEGSVKTHLSRAISALQSLLAQEGLQA